MASMVTKALMCACILVCCSASFAAAAEDQQQQQCGDVKKALMPCFSAVVGSNPPAPSKECCGGMKELLSRNPSCACLLLTSGAATVPNLNKDAAKKLPVSCGLADPNPNPNPSNTNACAAPPKKP